MGFDDANHQELRERAEYEACEKEEKRKLSECCCPEGDFRYCHGQIEATKLQVESFRKALTTIDALRKRLPDPDFAEQTTTAKSIAEVIRAVTEKKTHD